jgi:hypothetical protein
MAEQEIRRRLARHAAAHRLVPVRGSHLLQGAAMQKVRATSSHGV